MLNLRHRGIPKIPAKGFTLIEIMLAMFIVIVLFGAIALVGWNITQTHPLKEFSQSLETFIRDTRRESVERNEPLSIFISEKGFSRKLLESARDSPDLRLPQGVSFEILLWPNERWQKPSDQQWVFQPNGLSLPVSIKLYYESSWLSAQFDPMTGSIQDETYAFED
ncbi:MAG: prepilin-type N-terminal cleavage/methylation domain-containing protein [Verrucomicrobiota bacterium]